MTKKSFVLFLFMVLGVALFATGCGSSSGSMANKRYIWPEPPDSPRVEYITTFRGESDFSGGISRMLGSITGSTGVNNFTRPYDICLGENGVYYVTDAVLGVMK